MSNGPLIKVEKLTKYYPVRRRLRRLFDREQHYVRAVDDISLEVERGEILGLAGESGSGKTTTGEIIVRLQEATSGVILLDGHPLEADTRADRKRFRREVQMIFQDPYETLNPRFNVFETIAEPLRIHGVRLKSEIARRVSESLEIAELKPAANYLHRFPHELSGGQRQRVAIARGIVLEPKVLIADEPVSMLDVSIRADILNLLKRLRRRMGLTMIYVSHDLATIKYLCDRIAVMYLGKIVEIGPADEVIAYPQHPYTRVLVSSVPVADPDYVRAEVSVDDAPPDQINLPEGCRFTPRCPFAQSDCAGCDHRLLERRPKQFSACIYTEAELKPRSIP
ncbi:MAG: ABC transporter ATP-binding protein [Spirochaetaceae bacterium]|nr:MAG: ABC transporter ATP-binding protein [Spirochaetaceae bacterium]